MWQTFNSTPISRSLCFLPLQQTPLITSYFCNGSWHTQVPSNRNPYVATAIAMEEGARYINEWTHGQISNPTQPNVKKIPNGAMIPTTANRFRNVTCVVRVMRNIPTAKAAEANNKALATTIAWTASDKMLTGIIHLAAKKMMLTGRAIASKSAVAMLTRASVSSKRKNGWKITQPITPDTAKYGSAKISNISIPRHAAAKP
jgi:hypothetical protein